MRIYLVWSGAYDENRDVILVATDFEHAMSAGQEIDLVDFPKIAVWEEGECIEVIDPHNM